MEHKSKSFSAYPDSFLKHPIPNTNKNMLDDKKLLRFYMYGNLYYKVISVR